MLIKNDIQKKKKNSKPLILRENQLNSSHKRRPAGLIRNGDQRIALYLWRSCAHRWKWDIYAKKAKKKITWLTIKLKLRQMGFLFLFCHLQGERRREGRRVFFCFKCISISHRTLALVTHRFEPKERKNRKKWTI